MDGDFCLSMTGPNGGGAFVTFASGDVSIWVEFESLMDDALSGLIEIGVRMLRGYKSYTYTNLIGEISPPAGSSQYVISVQASMKPDEIIELEIKDTSEDRDVIIVCPLLRYVKQVLKLFDSYKYEHGADEYEARWYHSFPEERLELLRDLYHANKAKYSH